MTNTSMPPEPTSRPYDLPPPSTPVVETTTPLVYQPLNHKPGAPMTGTPVATPSQTAFAFEQVADAKHWARQGRKERVAGASPLKNRLYTASAVMLSRFKWWTPLVAAAYFAAVYWLIVAALRGLDVTWTGGLTVGMRILVAIPTFFMASIPEIWLRVLRDDLGSIVAEKYPTGRRGTAQRDHARSRRERVRTGVKWALLTIALGAFQLLLGGMAIGFAAGGGGDRWMIGLLPPILFLGRAFFALGASRYANELITRVQADDATVISTGGGIFLAFVAIFAWKTPIVGWVAILLVAIVLMIQWQWLEVKTTRHDIVRSGQPIATVLAQHALPEPLLDASMQSTVSSMQLIDHLSKLARTPSRAPKSVNVLLGSAPALQAHGVSTNQGVFTRVLISQNPPMWSQAHWGFEVFGRDAHAPRGLTLEGGRPLVYGRAGTTVQDGIFGELGEVGAKGEHKTEAWMNHVAASNGILVLHDIVLHVHDFSQGYDINVDHVAITANNLIIVDSKVWRRGTYRLLGSEYLVIDDQIQQENHTDGKALAMAADALSPLSSHLNLVTSKVLAVYGANVESLETTNHVAAPWVWVRDVLASCGAVRVEVVDALIRSGLVQDRGGQLHMDLSVR